MARISLSPPWITFVKELEQMFLYDAEVHVVYDDDEHVVKLYVDSTLKASALKRLLPEVKVFGDITLIIQIVSANGTATVTKHNLYPAAFAGNGALAYTKTVTGIFTNDLTYVVFRKQVVQYYNDDLGDVNGQKSTLYEDIARDLFLERDGVYFCTDKEDPVYVKGAPLGEWP